MGLCHNSRLRSDVLDPSFLLLSFERLATESHRLTCIAASRLPVAEQKKP